MARKKQPPQQPSQPPVSLLDADRFLSSPELAGLLGVEISTLDQWASRGGGPVFHKVGVHRKYAPADVRAWLAERRYATTGDPRPAA